VSFQFNVVGILFLYSSMDRSQERHAAKMLGKEAILPHNPRKSASTASQRVRHMHVDGLEDSDP
jgi:hypothetical protein